MHISKINSAVTKKICANQVIVSLSDAIKELLENSLDAKSDKIEIRFKNFGADLIEVYDNGTGISCGDLPELMKGHSTSKLEGYDDLSNLATFGFRGEALSALCTLGEVQIHTCTASSSVGTFISYDQHGLLTSSTSLARQMGTTVSVKNLFHNLPVRRRQLLTNVRREYDKAVHNVTSYCLLSVGTQIACYRLDCALDQRPGTPMNVARMKQSVVNNGAAKHILSNIEAVFGSKQMKALTELRTELQIDQSIMDEFSLSDCTYTRSIQIEGCISKPTEDTGRSSSDRQFLFVNGRPCDVIKITKVITACYKNVNNSQSPVFVISINLPKNSIDVNVEPNKRMILFDHLPHVLAAVKASVLSAFSRCGSSADSRNMNTSLVKLLQPSLLFDRSISSVSDSPLIKRSFTATHQSSPTRSHHDLSPVWSSTPKRVKAYDSIDHEPSSVAIQDPCAKQEDTRAQTRAHFSTKMLAEADVEGVGQSGLEDSSYRARIAEEDNALAEEELRRIFRKEQFLDMEPLGQFNLGFIVARSGADLFIVDQHASDERCRFERLLDECKLGSQPLAQPQRLLLGAGGEQLLLDNVDTFERCGFRFEMRESGAGRDRLLMTAACCRGGLVLGASDVVEMLAVLRDSTDCRLLPSRIRAAVASNACRSAIMIGRSLSRAAMAQVVRNMHTLRNPWCCAHGRPTMRHLCAVGDA